MIAEILNSDVLRIGAYLVVAAGCVAAALREGASRPPGNRRAALFWWFVASIVLILAVGRFTELGPWFTERGRHIAESQGWYDDRRSVQEAVVRALIVAGTIGIAAGIVWSLLASSRQHPLALTAVIYLLTYVGIRAISLHQVDRVLYTERAAGIRPNGVLELAGTALLAAAVLVAIVDPARSRSGAIEGSVGGGA